MTKMIRQRLTILAAAMLGAVVLTGCATKSVERILADPGRYRDRDVRVSGVVDDSFSVLNRGAYRVADETGKLWVVSDRGVPRKGARVTVEGTIRQGVDLGFLGRAVNLPDDLSAGLVLMESSHKVR